MRGGYRPGAGRKKGIDKAIRSSAIAKQELARGEGIQGITPLQVVLRTMRALWAEATAIDPETGKEVLDTGKAKEASVIASAAMPYVHPRLNAIDKSALDRPDEPDQEDLGMLEAARRLAFTITMGAREAAKVGLPAPKTKTVQASKRSVKA